MSRERGVHPSQSRSVLRRGALLVVAATTSCAEAESSPARGALPASASPSGAVAAPAASPAPLAIAAPRSRAGGVCNGAEVGARRCDGATLVRCDADAHTVEATCGELSRCDAAGGRCASTCPAGMVRIPATPEEGFIMGRDYLGSIESPGTRFGKGHDANTDHAHPVKLTRAFCLDQNEVTVAEWTACMDAGRCPKPNLAHRFHTWPDHPDHPINCVDWNGARGYCGWRGKTLPSETQWEWAATQGDRRDYPWGNEPASCEHADYVPGFLGHPAGDAGCRGGGPSPVGSHPAGDIAWPDGPLHDMAGNVWEWCLDNYRAYEVRTYVDHVEWRGAHLPHVVRGGGWNRSHLGIRAAFRGAAVADYTVPGLGFRCALNPPGVVQPGDP